MIVAAVLSSSSSSSSMLFLTSLSFLSTTSSTSGTRFLSSLSSSCSASARSSLLATTTITGTMNNTKKKKKNRIPAKDLTRRTIKSSSSLLPFRRRTTTHDDDDIVIVPDESLVDITSAPTNFDMNSAVVYGNFISNEQGNSLIYDLNQKFKRKRRYENGHWDAVIRKYKETELLILEDDDNNENNNDNDNNAAGLSLSSRIALNKVRDFLSKYQYPTMLLDNSTTTATTTTTNDLEMNDSNSTQKIVSWLPCHAIDLHEDGILSAHTDSIRFSGMIVAGISLSSTSIMRLKPSQQTQSQTITQQQEQQQQHQQVEVEQEEGYYVDMLLPPLSLYVLSGASRYHYTHELLPDQSIFRQPSTQSKQQQRRRPRIIKPTNTTTTTTTIFDDNDDHDDIDNEGQNSMGIVVERGRRLSIIFRDALTTTAT